MTDPNTLLEALRKELAKEYEIQEFVGRGSIALVFKAVQREPSRTVALKVVPPDAPAGLGERVRRQARVAVNLTHANIVPIYAVGQAAGADYYTMKYVDGCSLDRVIANHGALPVPLVLTVLRAVLSGLAYAHDRRVIHREVMGANVFVDREGGVALADTGIARAVQEQGATAPAIGFQPFMSPEQSAGKQVGPQADQYSIGVLTFQMLTGRPPFEAATAQALLELHAAAPSPEIGMARADVPRELIDVVLRALSRTPTERYPTTRDMLRAVEAVPLSPGEQSAAVSRLQELARRTPLPMPLSGSAPPPPAPRVSAPPLLDLELELAEPEPAPPPAPRVSAPQPPPEPVHPPRRSEPAAPTEPPSEPPRPRRRIPIVAIVGGVALVGVAAVVAVVSMGKREETARPPAAADSARTAAADSARAAAPIAPSAPPAVEVGYVRVRGDLPEDAIIWLDGRRMPTRLFQASPGGHGLEIETGEFEPWETRITVRVGDTLRVAVELVLKTPSDSLQ